MEAKRKSLWELNAAVLLWAGTALFAKWIPLPAFQITGLRAIAAAGILGLLLVARRQEVRVRNRRDLLILIVSGLAMAAHWITYFQAIKVSTVAIGILALHSYPVMTALAEPLWFRERFKAADVLLAVVVAIGLAVLVPRFAIDSQVLQGTLWGVLSAAFFTTRNLLTRQLVGNHGSGKITFYQLAATAIALFPVVLQAGVRVDATSALKLVLLGTAFTALPHTLYTRALQQLSARSAGIISTLLPIYGAVAAALLLGEVPTPRTMLGGAIVLTAVTLETWRTLRARR